MRFSLILIVISFATSVRAAHFNRRELSEGVQSCVTELNSVQSGINELNSMFDAFNYKNILESVDLQKKEQKLEHQITVAVDRCCRLKNPIDPGEARTLIDFYKSLVPNVDGMLNSLTNKKSIVDGIEAVSKAVKNDIRTISTYVKAANRCVLIFIPNDLKREIQDSVDKIVASLDKVNKDFGN